MKKNIVFFILILIIFNLGCFGNGNNNNNNNNNNNGNNNKEIEYVYEIQGEIDGEFIVIIPVSLNETYMPMFLESNFIVNYGEITFRYLETEYGIGLEIIGKNNFELKATTSDQKLGIISLSTQNITINDYGSYNFRIFLNSTQSKMMSISISCYDKNENFGVNEVYIEKTSISNGWQEVEGLYTKLVS